jgi:CRP-like cAMP-binding protein
MITSDIIALEAGGNNLLRSLKRLDHGLILPHLTEITVKKGQVLYEHGDDVKYAYFPCDKTLLSFVVLLDDGRGVETALIGREGAVGGIVSHGRLPAYCRTLVQFSGKLLRIDSMQLEEAKMASLNVRHLFARYADCLMAQIFQSVACNATHTIEQRTAKWLVAALDRTGEHVVPLSQEQLAGMLGVGRSYIARVIGVLKARGVLKTMRGGLSITSFNELKKLSCGCNDLVNHHFDTVLTGLYPQEAG